MTPEVRKKLRESIEFIYDGFLKRVSDGRHKSVEAIEPLAQGRVWLGVQARDNGLVDQLGGLDSAIEILKKKANVAKEEQVRLIVYPRSKTLFEQLFSKGEAPDWAAEPSDPSALFRKLPAGVAPWLYGGMMRVMPYRLELR